jgi:NAD(P)-dependent dehydrogenase (short-subunit alcohol dehydrogenase family)
LKEVKNILCFGANSYLAQTFFTAFARNYNIIKVFRKKEQGLWFDFDSDEESVCQFLTQIPSQIDGILFFQGINPSVGLDDTSIDHFSRMIKINVTMPTLIIKNLKRKLRSGCSVVFFSSVAKRKGSYDPAYGAAKSALSGLIQSLANACPDNRFNILSLGLVEGSPVHLKMTADFVKRHVDKMFKGKLIDPNDVVRMVNEILINQSINRAEVLLEGGYL